MRITAILAASALAVILLAATLASAQTMETRTPFPGTVIVTVRDSLSRSPVAGVRVLLVDWYPGNWAESPYDNLRKAVGYFDGVTDSRGVAKISDLRPGRFQCFVCDTSRGVKEGAVEVKGTRPATLELLLGRSHVHCELETPPEVGSRLRSVSSTPPADTLANGLPRDVAAKLQPVARLWRYGLPRFALDSLVRGAASVVRPDFAWGGKDARDIGDRNLDVWSPDSTRWLNHDFYIEASEEGGSVEFGGDVDSAPVFGDVKRDSVARLDFCGTPCAFDGAWWVDNSRFVLIGNIEADPDTSGNREFFLDLYDLNAMRRSRWLGRPLSEARFKCYLAACDSSLGVLYRRNLTRRR